MARRWRRVVIEEQVPDGAEVQVPGHEIYHTFRDELLAAFVRHRRSVNEYEDHRPEAEAAGDRIEEGEA